MKMPAYRVGVDTGGTFSDFCVLNQETGEIITTKVPSTPKDPSQAVIDGVRQLVEAGVHTEDIVSFSHGTTVGTNALLEEKGSQTGVLVTDGLRGINDIYAGSALSQGAFELYRVLPKYLVPPRLCLGVKERVDFRGNVIEPLDKAQSTQAILKLKEKGVESLVVCFLFSFMNPEHEREVAELIRENHPGCFISLSSEVLPQIREHTRLSTTIVNSKIGPVLNKFLLRLEQRLREQGMKTKQLYVMQCNGGVRTFEASAARAVPLVLSGPAAGIMAVGKVAELAGFPNVIGLDMGGTSCDIGLVKDGEVLQTIKASVGKWDIAIPMLDVNTISAGGGTIARVDSVGNLVLGPESAGADPGPVCYGKGGTSPTVTDANLVLGFLSPDFFLAGKMKLDKEKAQQAIMEKIAKPLGLGLLEAADGIIRVINADMEQGVRAVSAEKGYDPRDFVLFAFGGAGPVSAARLAAALNIPKVMVPLAPGVTSALGLLLADVRHDYVRSHLDPLASLEPNMVNGQFSELAEKATAELVAEGFSRKEIQIAYFMDMRYSGQGYEITVPAPSGHFDKSTLETMRSRFDTQHERLFGHKAETQPVEVVSYRLVSMVAVPKPNLKKYSPATTNVESALKSERQVYFGRDAGSLRCPIYDRDGLFPGHVLKGPVIVEQMDSTTVIYPGQSATVDSYRNIIISTLEG